MFDVLTHVIRNAVERVLGGRGTAGRVRRHVQAVLAGRELHDVGQLTPARLREALQVCESSTNGER